MTKGLFYEKGRVQANGYHAAHHNLGLIRLHVIFGACDKSSTLFDTVVD